MKIVIVDRYGLRNDSGGHLNDARCVSNVRFLLGKLYAKIQ